MQCFGAQASRISKPFSSSYWKLPISQTQEWNALLEKHMASLSISQQMSSREVSVELYLR